MRIALLGGSFDPPHLAHQVACLYLIEGEGFEQVWLIPCFRHAFGKPLAPFAHRIKMCELLAKPFVGRVVVSDVESGLTGELGVNRTVDTVAALQAQHPGLSFTFVIGSDNIPQAPAWKDFDRLRSLVPFLVLRRPGWTETREGWSYSKVVLPEISSTAVRELLAGGSAVEGLVPGSVAAYIRKQSLYRS